MRSRTDRAGNTARMRMGGSAIFANLGVSPEMSRNQTSASGVNAINPSPVTAPSPITAPKVKIAVTLSRRSP